ncbi:SigE family RNA polymerase sigma factor [Kribbella sp. NBC_01245]|uniref:SigE family RNA polymerase sigma factor n=1 Tax=Kribbella sp. NBC_01245 TaxID=2903578 RepID=UPI002E2A692B|nr:SigE family RNA polymerase sigma factor [Kribbella sp. NBC_01245]
MADDGFHEFVIAASPRLLGSARLISRDWHTAEDLVQETLIRVCLRWSTIADHGNATAYAYRTLVRLTRRSGRRLYLSRERPTGGHWELDQVTSAMFRASDDSDGLSDVEAQLARLPSRQRQTIVLRYFADLSVEMTAEVMQCSAGTVKSQTAKGLAVLRERLTTNSQLAPRTGPPR